MDLLKLVDKEERNLNYLRISITDKCNLKCVYCTPSGFLPKLKSGDILTYEELLHLVNIAVSLGIRKVRITGGEPLIRKDIFNFIETLSSIDNLTDLSLTTNGVFLLSNVDKIKNAGIKRLNVSLDSLKTEKYEYITNSCSIKEVLDGIKYAYALGINPIKINIVVIRGINDDEILDFAKLSFFYPFHIRFIEFMPIGMTNIELEQQILVPEIMKKLSCIGNLRSVECDKNDGPARRFKFDGSLGEIGFISALSHNFCSRCNRLRLTADGELRSCLLSDISISLKELIRHDCSNDVLIKAFVNLVKYKGKEHNLSLDVEGFVKRGMYSIGG